MVSTVPGSFDRVRRFVGRAARPLLRVLGMMSIGLCLAGVLLLLAPVRGGLLDLGVRLADRVLPGRLFTAATSWPRPGTLILEDVVWLEAGAAGDTLAHLRKLVVGVDLGALRNRDLLLDSLVVRAVTLDLPRLVATFPSAADTTDDAWAGSAPWYGSWLRAGAWDLLPSVGISHLDVGLAEGVLDTGLLVRGVGLRGRAEFRAGHEPELALLRGHGHLWQAGETPFELDLRRLTLDTRYEPTDAWLHVDSLVVVIAAVGPPALAARWREAAPLRLDAAGRVRWQSPHAEIELELGFDFPGADLTGAAWPDFLAPEPFAAVVGNLVLNVDVVFPDSVVATIALDLGDSRWLERGFLRANVALDPADPLAATVSLENLDLAVPCLAVRGGGTLADGRAELALATELDGADLRQSLLGVVLDTLLVRAARDGSGWADSLRTADFATTAGEVAVDLVAVLPDHLTATVDVDLGGSSWLKRGRLLAAAELDPAAPLAATVRLDTIDLALPGLTVYGHGALDSAEVDLELALSVASPNLLLSLAGPPLADADLDLTLDLTAAGPRRDPELDLSLGGRFASEPITVPELDLHLAGKRAAADLRLRAAGGLAFDGLIMADSLLVNATWRSAPHDTLPLLATVLVGLGGDHLSLGFAAGADTVARLRVDSLTMMIAGQRLALTEPVRVRLDTTRSSLVVSRAEFTGDPGTIHFSGNLAADAITVEGGVDLRLTEEVLQTLAPAPIWSQDGGLDLEIAGALDLGGTLGRPRFGGDLGLHIRRHRDDPLLGARLEFHLVEGDSGGLGADLVVTATDTVLVRANLLWPGRADFRSGLWIPAPGRSIHVEIPEQSLQMSYLDPVLPQEVSLRGELLVAALAAMPVRGVTKVDTLRSDNSGGIEGRVVLDELRVELPNRSRLLLSMDCRVTGQPLDPTVNGTITVESGFLRIPELPRNLLPIQGEARLWELVQSDSALAAVDAAGFALADWGAQDAAAKTIPFIPDLDLTVIMPGNLRIHGYGLNLEVAGDLHVDRGYDPEGVAGPALQGDVRAVNGTLKFMNRLFDFTRGTVEFSGAVPPNPYLDLQLETNISGTLIRIQVSGWADDPLTDLTSEPAMNEVDIMSFLLFGRTLSDLDGDQRGRMNEEDSASRQLRENLAGLAVAFGTADLQNSMTNTLGVDMVEMGSDSQGGSTLSAGKFISPKVLLKYHQSLEKSGTYFMTLEYSLTQVFKLLSTYGQGEEASGLELLWIRRY